MKGGERDKSLRLCAREMMYDAAQAGFSGAQRLGALSPREIELELAALAERRRQEAELADFQAWLTGRYVLFSLHAPRRYPRRPEGVCRRPRRMTDDEMKAVFAAMAAERREHGGC